MAAASPGVILFGGRSLLLQATPPTDSSPSSLSSTSSFAPSPDRRTAPPDGSCRRPVRARTAAPGGRPCRTSGTARSWAAMRRPAPRHAVWRRSGIRCADALQAAQRHQPAEVEADHVLAELRLGLVRHHLGPGSFNGTTSAVAPGCGLRKPISRPPSGVAARPSIFRPSSGAASSAPCLLACASSAKRASATRLASKDSYGASAASFDGARRACAGHAGGEQALPVRVISLLSPLRACELIQEQIWLPITAAPSRSPSWFLVAPSDRGSR